MHPAPIQRARAALFFIAAAIFPAFAPVLAQTLQAIPALNAHVIDTTATLDSTQRAALDAKLTAFEKRRGAQIVVLMVASTQPEDIASYAQRVGDSWKIGRKDIGDGLLLLVAKSDRQMRIATTKTLEGAIPDLAARQIIDNAMVPRFRQGDFAGGLNAAADQIMARISGENLPLPAGEPASDNSPSVVAGFRWTDLAVFVFFVVPFAARLLTGLLGRKTGALATGAAAGLLAWLFTSSLLLAIAAAALALVVGLFSSLTSLASMGRGGSSWGGRGSNSGWGGGGGFSSGGGGDFGGGGASGKW